jgi:preprotein translocase subunit SecE
VAYFLLAPQGALAQWGGLLQVSLPPVVAFGVRVRQALAGVLADSWKEVQEGRLAGAPRGHPDDGLRVCLRVFVMALFLWLTDKTLEWVFYDLILGWR